MTMSQYFNTNIDDNDSYRGMTVRRAKGVIIRETICNMIWENLSHVAKGVTAK